MLAGWRRLTAAVQRMRCRKKNRPSIRIPFPEEVTIWLDVWFNLLWPLLANEVGVGQPAICLVCALRRAGGAVREADVLSPVLLQGVTSAFCSFPRGVALKPATMTSYFKVGKLWLVAAAMQCCCLHPAYPACRRRLQEWVNMCPKRARHVFITDRLKNPHIPGPDNESAALAMGNTVEQWFRTYYPQAAHDKVSWPQTPKPLPCPATHPSVFKCNSSDQSQFLCPVPCR
jgi:hypothetical protein